MPNDLVRKIAEQQGISIHEVEKYWNNAKSEAKKEHPTNPWAYITSIVEKETGYKPNKDNK